MSSVPFPFNNNNKRQENAAAASSDASVFKRTWDHVKAAAAAGTADAKGAAAGFAAISPARKRNPLAASAATAGANGVASHAAAFAAAGSTPGRAGGFMGPPPPRPKGDESVKVRVKKRSKAEDFDVSIRGKRGNGKKNSRKKKKKLFSLSPKLLPLQKQTEGRRHGIQDGGSCSSSRRQHQHFRLFLGRRSLPSAAAAPAAAATAAFLIGGGVPASSPGAAGPPPFHLGSLPPSKGDRNNKNNHLDPRGL